MYIFVDTTGRDAEGDVGFITRPGCRKRQPKSNALLVDGKM